MNRTYYNLAQRAMEVALLAYEFDMNAIFLPDADEETRRYLDVYMKEIEHARRVMFLALTRQSRYETQERDTDLTIRKDHEIHDSNRY